MVQDSSPKAKVQETVLIWADDDETRIVESLKTIIINSVIFSLAFYGGVAVADNLTGAVKREARTQLNYHQQGEELFTSFAKGKVRPIFAAATLPQPFRWFSLNPLS